MVSTVESVGVPSLSVVITFSPSYTTPVRWGVTLV
jgi:hypothetical protein